MWFNFDLISDFCFFKLHQRENLNIKYQLSMVCFINFEIFFNCLLFSDPKTPTEEVILALTNGTYFHKIRSFDKFYYRKYHVDLETMRIYYKPSVKSYYFKEVPYSKIIYFIKYQIIYLFYHFSWCWWSARNQKRMEHW